MARTGSLGRSLLIGALLGLLAVAVVVVALLVSSGSGSELLSGLLGEPEEFDELLVACETEDADGAVVTGVVLLVSSSGEVTWVDPYAQVAIPGTTYDRLQDAASFGGGEALASAYASREDQETPEWLLVDREACSALIESADGVEIDVPESANVFFNDELFVFERGTQAMDADEFAAWLVWIDSLSGEAQRAASKAASEAVGQIVVEEWERLADTVGTGGAASSVSAEALQEFGAGQ